MSRLALFVVPVALLGCNASLDAPDRHFDVRDDSSVERMLAGEHHFARDLSGGRGDVHTFSFTVPEDGKPSMFIGTSGAWDAMNEDHHHLWGSKRILEVGYGDRVLCSNGFWDDWSGEFEDGYCRVGWPVAGEYWVRVTLLNTYNELSVFGRMEHEGEMYTDFLPPGPDFGPGVGSAWDAWSWGRGEPTVLMHGLAGSAEETVHIPFVLNEATPRLEVAAQPVWDASNRHLSRGQVAITLGSGDTPLCSKGRVFDTFEGFAPASCALADATPGPYWVEVTGLTDFEPFDVVMNTATLTEPPPEPAAPHPDGLVPGYGDIVLEAGSTTTHTLYHGEYLSFSTDAPDARATARVLNDDDGGPRIQLRINPATCSTYAEWATDISCRQDRAPGTRMDFDLTARRDWHRDRPIEVELIVE